MSTRDWLKQDIKVPTIFLVPAKISALGLLLEAILRIGFHINYVGLAIGIFSCLIKVEHRYQLLQEESEKLFKRSSDYFEGLKLLKAPPAFIDIMLGQLHKLKHDGYEVSTEDYTNYAAKFLMRSRTFRATWTIEVDLKYMHDDYKSQQTKLSFYAKERYVVLSKTALAKQKEDQINEFIKWHSDSGIKLYWINRRDLHSIMANASGEIGGGLTRIINNHEDFLLLDETIIFSDTNDEIKEGSPPKKDKEYYMKIADLSELEPTVQKLIEAITNGRWPLFTIELWKEAIQQT